jgi:hypothetical protein
VIVFTVIGFNAARKRKFTKLLQLLQTMRKSLQPRNTIKWHEICTAECSTRSDSFDEVLSKSNCDVIADYARRKLAGIMRPNGTEPQTLQNTSKSFGTKRYEGYPYAVSPQSYSEFLKTTSETKKKTPQPCKLKVHLYKPLRGIVNSRLSRHV